MLRRKKDLISIRDDGSNPAGTLRGARLGFEPAIHRRFVAVSPRDLRSRSPVSETVSSCETAQTKTRGLRYALDAERVGMERVSEFQQGKELRHEEVVSGALSAGDLVDGVECGGVSGPHQYLDCGA